MPENINPTKSADGNSSDSSVVEQEQPTVTTHTTSRHKTQKDLEKDDILRKLQGLMSGDKLFFKKTTLGHQVSNPDAPTSNDFVESRFVCWIYDRMSIYLIVNLKPYGRLRFKYGDLYEMALAHDLFFHKLDSRYIKIIKSDHGVGAKKTDQTKIRQDTADMEMFPQSASHKNDVEILKQKIVNSDFKNRPMPPGVEEFLKCKFTNKNDLVKKLRSKIRSNKNKFMEMTRDAKELRLILTQNVRAYEVEVVSYMMDQDPWAYSSNKEDKPSDQKIKEILERYKDAVKNPLYVELYNKWQAQGRS
ncbi:hypothetical protein MACK_003564 [Theileria orientalis]|uniref:Uncharacterized protein n=1 Tax=Theileria orientalis TaxID=68886 RepID=A0A976SJE2_THEOR|nr:hypothetical protein MACK_003564 [Theileria orientalis]